ncbi:MAG: hypothetical protein C0631_15165 [Sedimenticola sp.]|nr:MAG: hypothetical protein C0631_15165 [Sedimenticola sp.]
MAVAPKQSGLNILRRLVPLNTLSDDVLQGLMDKAVFEKLNRGDHVFEKGDTDHFNVYLLSGRVAMLNGSREVDAVDAGSDMARFPIAHQIPRKFTVVARSKVEIVRIDNRLLGELLAKAGNATYEVSEFAAEETDDWMSQLLNSRVFQQIPASNIQSVMMRMQEQEVVEGDIIINYGDDGDYFYLINKGRCSVQRPSDDGSDSTEVAQLGPGDSFGEEALLSDKPRSSTVAMLTDGVLLRLSKDDFVQFVKHPLAKKANVEDALSQAQQGVVLLDVRSSEEYEKYHLPGSLSLPFGSLRYQAASLDPEQTYIVYCSDGQQSAAASYLLIEQGFDVSVLEGGIAQAQNEFEKIQPTHSENVVALRPDQERDQEREQEREQDGGEQVRKSGDAKAVEFLKKELSSAQIKVRDQKQQINNFKLAFDEAKELLAKHQDGEKKAQQQHKQLDQQLQQLKGELQEKAQELEALRALNQKLDESEGRLKALNSSLDDAQNQISQLQAENSTLHDLVEQGEQTLGEKQSAFAAVMDELGAFKTDAERLQSELASKTEAEHKVASEQQQQLSALTQQLETLTGELESAKGQLAAVEKEREDLQLAQGDSRQTIDNLQTQIADAEQTFHAEKQQLDQSRADLEAELNKAAEALSQSQQSAEQLQQNLTDSNARIEALEGQLTQRDGDLAEKNSSYEKQLKDLQQIADERDSLQGQLQELQKLSEEHAGLQEQLKDFQLITDERDSLQGQLQELQKLSEEHAGLQEQLKDLQQITEERDSLQGQLQELQKLSEEHAVLQEQLKDLQHITDERDSLQGQLQELQKLSEDHAVLQEQLKDLQQITDERDNLQGQLQELQKLSEDHAVLQERLQDLQQITEERDQLLGQSQETQQLRSEQENLLRQIAGFEQEKERLAAELADAQIQAEALESRLNGQLTETTASNDQLKTELSAAQQSLDEVQQREQAAQEKLLSVEQALEKRSGDQAEQAQRESALEADVQRQAEELEQSRQRIQQLESELDGHSATSQQIDELNQQLAAAEQARQTAEEALEKSKRTSATTAGGDAKILQAELDTLTDALEEADKSYADLKQELDEVRLQRDKQQAELESLQAQLAQSQAAEVTPEAASELEAAVAAERERREAAEREVEHLGTEVTELRSVMQTYVEQIQSARNDSGDEPSAVQAEVALVREQAEADIARLQEALDQALAAAKERELSDSVDTSENRALKEDLEKLQRTLSEHQTEIELLTRDKYQIQEKVEERNSEIERLKNALEMAQVDADEALFNRDEALEAKKLVDDALYKLQQDLEQERRPQQLADNRLATSGTPRALDFSALAGSGMLFKGLVLGALLAFGAAEVMSVMAGKGELISGFMAAGEDSSGKRSAAEDELALQRNQAVDKGLTLEETQQVVEQASVTAVSDKSSGIFVQGPVNDELQPEAVEIKRPEIGQPPAAVQPRVSEPKVEAPQPVEPKQPPPRKIPARSEPETGSAIRDRLTSTSMGPEMVYIRGAEFTMGSDRSQLQPEERPAHKVKLKSFAIGRYEVTFDEYAEFANATGRSVPDDLGWGGDRRPVINVSWEDATAYAEWLSAETGRRYRLPTESEWEFAAAGGSESYYWWGYDLDPGKANCFNCGSIWDGASTAPVGSFEGNGFGLHNTAGNVMEWVADCYFPSYQGAPDDGSAWVEDDCRERTIRGGAFNKPGDALRTTNRSRHDYDAKLFILGFRVARDVR